MPVGPGESRRLHWLRTPASCSKESVAQHAGAGDTRGMPPDGSRLGTTRDPGRGRGYLGRGRGYMGKGWGYLGRGRGYLNRGRGYPSRGRGYKMSGRVLC
ncbi:unnamed protein product [Lampetra fluviatilis]